MIILVMLHTFYRFKEKNLPDTQIGQFLLQVLLLVHFTGSPEPCKTKPGSQLIVHIDFFWLSFEQS